MRKGSLTLADLPNLFYIIMIAGVFLGATYITLENFESSTRSDTAVTNESINFVANYTYYTITNTPLNSIVALYDNANHSFTIPTANWNTNYENTSIRVLTNGTGQWPNITTGVHYLSYTYGLGGRATTGIGYVLTFLDNISSNLDVVGIIVFVVILVGVVMWIRMKKPKGGA